MHSGGTSLTSKFLNYCGVDTTPNNKIDFLGEYKITRSLSHEILRENKYHRYSIDSVPFFKISKELEGKINRKINDIKLENWGFKAPINSLTIDVWLPILIKKDKVYVVLVLRNPYDVYKSFFRRKNKKDLDYIKSFGKDYEKTINVIQYNYYKKVIDTVKNFNCSFLCLDIYSLVERSGDFCKLLKIPSRNIRDIIEKNRLIKSEKCIKYKPLADMLDFLSCDGDLK